MRKDVKTLVKYVESLGFELVSTNKHYKYRNKKLGLTVTIPNSPSDHNWLRNGQAYMRRLIRKHPELQPQDK